MDKLCKYVDRELEEIEDKISMGGKLSGAEIEYADKLAHLKKSMLTNEAMEDSYSGGYYYDSVSMANGGRGTQGGRGTSRANNGRRRNYSRDSAREEFTEQLEDLMQSAPDEHTRRKVEKLMNEMR